MTSQTSKAHRTLNSALHRPRLWKRYVDDTLCIIGSNEVDELLLHINSIRPSIKFTVETEKDGSLPFLDTLVSRSDSGTLSFSVNPRNFVRSCSALRHRAQTDQEPPLTTIAVPYVSGLSEDIRRVCRQFNI